MHDIAYLYLDLLDRLDLQETVLVGSSFGGWVALEMAVRSENRIGRLVLIDSLGVKFGTREERDIADIYVLPGAAGNRARPRGDLALWLEAVHARSVPGALAAPDNPADAGAMG